LNTTIEGIVEGGERGSYKKGLGDYLQNLEKGFVKNPIRGGARKKKLKGEKASRQESLSTYGIEIFCPIGAVPRNQVDGVVSCVRS